jgi:hypothetical protein
VSSSSLADETVSVEVDVDLLAEILTEVASVQVDCVSVEPFLAEEMADVLAEELAEKALMEAC